MEEAVHCPWRDRFTGESLFPGRLSYICLVAGSDPPGSSMQPFPAGRLQWRVAVALYSFLWLSGTDSSLKPLSLHLTGLRRLG